ncbi:MAG: TIGR04190 family B12-binding domain/radical SAM domain protein [Chloroflexota bacterium]|nr:TIGR04190 family B12-binding domain/radical SAM domain protein [Chloroflexota bacterium]
MASLDLVLLHSPSIYDFRQRTILYGPISDLVPSSPIFDMYPIGFASIAEYLERNGYRVRIVNLAALMLRDKNFDVERAIRRLKSPVFGIDLHWLPHAHGAIEIARLVKRYHPQAKVVFGGLSSSYYYQQLLKYPEVDFVIRGDSTEKPFLELMNCIKNHKSLSKVPNLAWRDDNDVIQENAMSHVPDDLSDVMIRYYDNTVRSVIRYRDIFGYMPFKRWLSYPITAVLTCRGCTENCVICGGSAFGYRNYCHRDHPVYRTPQMVAQDVKRISSFSKGPIFILGDIRQPGEDYAYELLRLLQKQQVSNQLILELFSPASRDILEQMAKSCPQFCLQISPESHDPEVRRASGKHYSSTDLENTLMHALEAGCGRLDLFFMIGLSKQTPQSALDTIEYCKPLLKDLGKDNRFSCFTSPLAPFLDPGSLAYEKPERYGYKLFCHSLEDHRKALLAPSWKHTLSYETEWMNRSQIADVSYEAGLRLNRIKLECGLISSEVARDTEQRIVSAQEMLLRIDQITGNGQEHSNSPELSQLKHIVDQVSMSTVCEKTELDLSTGILKLRPFHAIWSRITDR